MDKPKLTMTTTYRYHKNLVNLIKAIDKVGGSVLSVSVIGGLMDKTWVVVYEGGDSSPSYEELT